MMATFSSMLHNLFQLFKWWIFIMPWEGGVRVRAGKWVKSLAPGAHLSIPFVDSCYVQTTRKRVSTMPMQTLTTKDGKTVSFVLTLGYTVDDILKLYQTLHHPETTLTMMALSSSAKYISETTLQSLNLNKVAEMTVKGVNIEKYGLGNCEVSVVGFAVVKTYRLLQDQMWNNESFDMDRKTSDPKQQ